MAREQQIGEGSHPVLLGWQGLSGASVCSKCAPSREDAKRILGLSMLETLHGRTALSHECRECERIFWSIFEPDEVRVK